MKRLRKLEGIVEELSGQVELEGVRHGSSAGQSPEAMFDSDTRAPRRAGSTTSTGSQGQGSPAASGRAITGLARTDSGATSSSQSGPVGQQRGFRLPERTMSSDINKGFGRLVLNDKGHSRYVSSEIWAKIKDELDHLRSETQAVTDDDSDASDHETPPDSETEDPSSSLAHQSFIFGYSSANVDLRPLHPSPVQIPFMWQIYQENVDPVVKILHIPTMNKLIREMRTNVDRLTPSAEALMFAIYYGVVVSLDADEVKQTLGAEKQFLLARYRFAVEQALAKANFLTDPDFTVCQAFVLFLILVRRHDKTRYAWTLTSLAVRSCQAIGLHRDGTNFPNLGPFDIEMNRRLFWVLSILDLRSAEDQGTDPILVEGSYDTKFPSNLDDSDISPGMTEYPSPREGATDMTFSLMRHEICNAVRRFTKHTSESTTPALNDEDFAKSLEEREARLLEVYHRLEKQYLNTASSYTTPIFWMAANITRVIVAKLVFVIYQPVLFAGPMDRLSCRIRNRVFIAAVEILEYSSMTITDPRFKHWVWLFRTYFPWHVISYILLDVSGRSWSASVERAWTALSTCFSGPNSPSLEKSSSDTAISVPFKKLFDKAKKHRDAEIARLRQDPAAALQLDLEDRTCSAPSTFGNSSLPGSTTSVASRERWRMLVNAPPVPEDIDNLWAASCPHQPTPQPNPQQQQAPQSKAPGSGRCPLLKPDDPSKTQPHSTQPSNPSTTEGTGVQEQDLDRLNNIMASVITSSHFNSADLYPIAFKSEIPAVSRDTVFGYSTADIPRVDHFLGTHGGPSTTAAAVDPLSVDENPPVWMWNDPVHHPNQALPDSLDIDMNMDDAGGLDWGNWQETMRGWSSQGINGGAGGVWENGI